MKESRSKFTLAERRNVLKYLGAAATLALPGWVLGENALWVPEDLPITPQQTEGPFYPETTIEQQLFNDTDLIRKLGSHEVAKGKPITVEGIIMDRKGKPLANSTVEVWQACASGRYNHSRDSNNPGLLDNNFQFWGRAVTGEDGRYSFNSIIPGKYPGRTGRHIHYRVDSEGFKRSTTQCYFSDFGEDNMRDGIYRSLNAKERKLVTVEFDKREPAKAEAKPNPKSPLWVGQFNVVLANA